LIVGYTHTVDITNQLLVTPKTKVGNVDKTNVITGVYATATCKDEAGTETSRSSWVMWDTKTSDPDYFVEYDKLTSLPGRATTQVNTWHTAVKEVLEKENADVPSQPAVRTASWS
jgi:hypothetical protein|tara:strand:+ start:274 stop:618 length:345 start_codon:yes stop_codon:yes gene_type:complete